jgi:hypothetical protein
MTDRPFSRSLFPLSYPLSLSFSFSSFLHSRTHSHFANSLL